MNDDELIQRLRRTLHAEADAVTPMRGPPRISPPVTRRRPGRRGLPYQAWVAMAAAAVIAVGVIVATDLHGGGRPVHVTVAGPRPPAVAPHHTTRPRRSPPAPLPTTTPAPPSSAAGTTVPSAPVVTRRVGADFVPRSVTFVSATDGWVLGTEGCAATTCLRLAHTLDGGASWTDQNAPATTGLIQPAALAGQPLQVRFATPDNGWIFSTATGAGLVWSTHDGGATWYQQTLPGGADATIDSLETADGRVVAAVVTAAGAVDVDSSTMQSDSWDLALSIGAGAGPVPQATVVLQQAAGWVVVDNRTVAGGARLSGGVWTPWTTVPCRSAEGPALVAAPTPVDLTAVCGPGVTGAASSQSVEASHDGGASFESMAAVQISDEVSTITNPSASTIVGIATAAPGTLVASFDGGVDWQTVYEASGATVIQVGFENPSQGVAVLSTSHGGTLLMTVDGGHDWYPVDLQD